MWLARSMKAVRSEVRLGSSPWKRLRRLPSVCLKASFSKIDRLKLRLERKQRWQSFGKYPRSLPCGICNGSSLQLATRHLPSAGINLAGNAEARLGDLAAAIGDRFFLFEIKPQSSKFSSEWKEKDRGGRVRRPKRAYASALDMAKAWNGDATATSAENRVISSLRCHHVAYWEVGSVGALDEQLCLQPYLRAVLNGSLHKHGLSSVVKSLRGNLNLA